MKYNDLIRDTIENNEVVVFMKGKKEKPVCGWSARIVRILNSLEVPFTDVDLLEDHPAIAINLKELYGWPTSPQLFLKGRLIGGSDIANEMYQSGELRELFDRELNNTAEEPTDL